MIVDEFLKEHSSFDHRFYEVLPSVCPDCGFPLEMSETLTGLHCSNVRCTSRVAQRLMAIASQLGVKDLGEARALAFVTTHKITNPLYIFHYDPDTEGQMAENISLELSRKIVGAFKAKNKFTLAEYIKIANIPDVQMSAFQIFGDFDDLSEAYYKIESDGIPYITSKLGIKQEEDGEESISVRAMKIYNSLIEFKQDFFDILMDVDIIQTHVEGMTNLSAVCSSDVGAPFKTKADFYATCNNLFADEVHIEFGNSVTKNTQYLVWRGADGSPAPVTNKVNKARAYIDKGVDIKIVTAMQFIAVLEGITGKKAGI